MRRGVGILAAALAMILAGCGGSVPGLSESDGVLLHGTVFGSTRASAARARQDRPRSPWDVKALRSHAPNPKFSAERTETAGHAAVRVREVTFEAEPVPGTSLSLFGYLATPALHGSGSWLVVSGQSDRRST